MIEVPTDAAIDEYCAANSLHTPEGLRVAHVDPPNELDGLLYKSDVSPGAPPSLEWARQTAASSQWPMPNNLVPLLPVDDQSIACVVAAPYDVPELSGAGAVIRWHLGVQNSVHQATLLDTDVELYAQSVAEELRARPIGLARMLDRIGPAFELDFLDKNKRPRDYVVRPVRIACQNVIIGLAAFAHDSNIDGMSVVAWQTCEVPHVATHEGNRALAALMLCDAFQSGGTMEIRFDRPARIFTMGKTKAGKEIRIHARYRGHPEMRVPASLRRYGRTVGIELGADDPASISPAEARTLFLAATPMPSDLAARVHDSVGRGIATPERLCFTLLSQIWREIELDFMLAVSDRASSILRGGAPWSSRPQRQAESHVARAAVMLGMFYRRLNTTDAAGATDEARVIEDKRVGVEWSVNPHLATATFRGLRPERIPWQDTEIGLSAATAFIVLPRPIVSWDDVELAQRLSVSAQVALMVAADTDMPPTPADLLVLRCPDRLGELDLDIERRLTRSRTARA